MDVDTLTNERAGALGQIFGKVIVVIPLYQVVARPEKGFCQRKEKKNKKPTVKKR